MTPVTGRAQSITELARVLAPGRAVTGISLHFPLKGIATATVTFFIDEADMPAVIEAAKDCQVVEQ